LSPLSYEKEQLSPTAQERSSSSKIRDKLGKNKG
jgi:hypothetical protein